jgi:hypothetical protein
MLTGAVAAQLAKDRMEASQRAEPAPPRNSGRVRIAAAAGLRRAAARLERPMLARCQ